MVKSLRLAWLRRLYTDEDAGWKRYLRFLIKPFGGHLLFHCDYEPREYNITNKFYAELIQFWAEFRNAFSTEDDSTSIIWNNKNIRINGKPVFSRRFFDKNLISIRQLRLHLNNAESLDFIRTDLELNCNFLVWAGLRSAIPVSLRGKENDVRLTNALGFYDNNTFFDATLAKSKGYYRFLIRLKATLPNSAKKLQSEFSIDATNLTMFYSLPKSVCLETYLRDFQFKVLNYITCSNMLLKKMGIVESDLCTFCNLTNEDIEHLFFSCSFSFLFWKDFELCWKKCTNSNINLTSQDVILGITDNNNGFLNYCIIPGKSIFYYCRRNNVKPNIQLFKVKLKQKYQTELYLARKNATLDNFNQKWLFNPLALKF